MLKQKTPNNNLLYDIQRRQALDIMGLSVWVKRHTPTQTYDSRQFEHDFEARKSILDTSFNLNTSPLLNSESSLKNSQSFKGLQHSQKVDSPNNSAPSATGHSASQYVPTVNMPVVSTEVMNEPLTIDLHDKSVQKITHVPNTVPIVQQATDQHVITQKADDHNLTEQNATDHNATLHDIVPAFELLGARYKAWVIMVDSAVFTTPQVAKLWQDIVQALSLTVLDLGFPLCHGMQQRSIANACLSGFIFNISGREDTQVAMLSDVPEGLDDERLIRVPHLDEMLKDGRLKKQFWQLIC